MGVIIILIINFALIFFFSGAIYPIFGLCYTLISISLSFAASDKKICKRIISMFIKNWDLDEIADKKYQNTILLSVAFLIESMKIGAAIGLFVEVSAILVLTFCILLAFGFFFEGYSSGLTISGAYYLAKLTIKIYQFFNSFFDKIMGFIVKVEFSVLGIEQV